jgi:drug/metabolite transporter (DMT)-like permease
VVVAFGRTAIGALLLLPLAIRSKALRPLRPHWKILLLYTAIEIVGPWVLLGHAEIRLNSSTTGLLIAMVPMVAAIILTVMGDDRLDLRRIAGLVLGLVGVALLVGLDIHVDDLIAIGQVMLVVLGYAVGPIIISRRLADPPVHRGRHRIAPARRCGVRTLRNPLLAAAPHRTRDGFRDRSRGRLYCRRVPGDVRAHPPRPVRRE